MAQDVTLCRSWPKALLALVLLAVATAGALAAPADGTFALPAAGREQVWEAESVAGAGGWKSVQSSRASGGALMRATSERSALRFTVDVAERSNLAIVPVLGPHGDRRPPRRFPYPLERRPGPDALGLLSADGHRTLLFTSPSTGRVGAVDGDTGKLLRTVSPGGYLADLVVDPEARRLYVADAAGDRILCLSVPDLAVMRQIPAAGAPWSLELHEGVLYVGCMIGRRVLALDPAQGRVTAEAALPYQVAHIEVIGDTKPQVAVWPVPEVIDLETRAPVEADNDQTGFWRRAAADVGPRNKPGFRRGSIEGPHRVRMEALVGTELQRATVDTTPITGGAPQGSAPPWLTAAPGPGSITLTGDRAFFTAPASGRVGMIKLADNSLLPPIEVGGYPADLVADAKGERIFVADAAGNRVVVLDAREAKVVGQCALPGSPAALTFFTPPNWVKGCQPSLLVACRGGKQVAAIDPATLAVTWQSPLAADPALAKVDLPPDSGWWPLIPLERIALALCTRLAVQPALKALKPRTLEDAGELAAPPAPKRHSSVTLDLSPGKRTYSGDNAHLLQISTQDVPGTAPATELVDTSDTTDAARTSAGEPLGPRDQAGAITLAVDDGPAFPWRRGVWATPDQHQLLQADTPEFSHWNAPVFTLEPGRHVLTLTAGSAWAEVDAVRVARTLRGWAEVTVCGEPPQAESLPERYRSCFYDREPVRISLRVDNTLPEPQALRLDYSLRNYMGEVVAKGRKGIRVSGQAQAREMLAFAPRDTGTFELTVTASSALGQVTREYRFLRVPKLEHPRLLFRREQMPAIRREVEKHGRLYDQYFAWLRRQCDQEGFLPKGLLTRTFGPALPEEQKKLPNGGTWRRYELGWRMIAVQLGVMFARDPAQRGYFRDRIAEILNDGAADWYCTFHHHGPFFPGCEAVLYDLVAATPGQADEAVAKLREHFRKSIGNMDVFPWTLAGIEEPLSSKERAVLCHVGEWLCNVERYFGGHMGARGGNRWLNDRTGCFCPYAGYGYSFIYLSRAFGEPRLHEKKMVAGFRTHTLLAHPRYDARKMLGEMGPMGEPLRWLDAMLGDHPLARSQYSWDPLIARLEGGKMAPEAVDEALRYQECASTSTPMAFVAPLGLMLGWYQPGAPQVGYDEMPPTVLFDVEGQAAMRSGWDPAATEVFFSCGVRDHVYRHQPTDLLLARAGQFLLGTASSWGDDGNSDPGKTWGNVVVIEPSDWIRRWGENKRHPRSEEYALFNRFSDEGFRYISRDRRLSGYAPAEGGFGGGMDLHGHTESVFLQDGDLLAYQTRPEMDYVAGDATNSWPLGLAEEVVRQVVYLKPDTVVVYDRVALGERAERAYWVSATGPELATSEGGFLVGAGDQALRGDVLLPPRATMETFDPSKPGKYTSAPSFSLGNAWFLFDGATKHQKVLEIHPETLSRLLENLVVLQAGRRVEGKDPAWSRPTGGVDGNDACVSLRVGERDVTVRFHRKGDVGGSVVMEGAGGRTEFPLAGRVEDTYRYWKADPRYRQWTRDRRFRFLAADGDKR